MNKHGWTELELLRKHRLHANVAIREMTDVIYDLTTGDIEDTLCDALEKVRAALNSDCMSQEEYQLLKPSPFPTSANIDLLCHVIDDFYECASALVTGYYKLGIQEANVDALQDLCELVFYGLLTDKDRSPRAREELRERYMAANPS